MSENDDIETHISVCIGVMRKSVKAGLASKLIEERDRAKKEMAREIAEYLRQSFTFEIKMKSHVVPNNYPGSRSSKAKDSMAKGNAVRLEASPEVVESDASS